MRITKPARAGLRVGMIGEGVCSRRVAALAERVGLDRPVVGLGTWRLTQPEGRRVPLLSARTPEEAVAHAARRAAAGGPGGPLV